MKAFAVVLAIVIIGAFFAKKGDLPRLWAEEVRTTALKPVATPPSPINPGQGQGFKGEVMLGNIGKRFARASWYGPGFYGKTLANGHVYVKSDTFVAHRRLAFGTKLKVTNLLNGRSITVVVKDRGPYVAKNLDREMDLSYAAAGELGARQEGVIPIAYEVVSAPRR